MIPITESYTSVSNSGAVTIYPKSLFEFVIINDAFSKITKYIKFDLQLKSLKDNSRLQLGTVFIRENGTQSGNTNQAEFDTWVSDSQTKNASLNNKVAELSTKQASLIEENLKETPDADVVSGLEADIATLNSGLSTLTTEVNSLAANPVTLIPNMIDKFDDFFTTYISDYDVSPAGAAYLASKVGVSITK